MQDRLIRLEERLRLQALLSAELSARIGELTESQLIALRFASDSELPGLVAKVLAANMAVQGHQEGNRHLARGHISGVKDLP